MDTETIPKQKEPLKNQRLDRKRRDQNYEEYQVYQIWHNYSKYNLPKAKN